MLPRTFYSYPRDEQVPAQLAFDVLLDRGASREDFMRNVASVHPVRIGPADPVWVEWATTNLFTGYTGFATQTHAEYELVPAGDTAYPDGSKLLLPAAQQLQRSRLLVSHITGELPYVHLSALQRGLHAERGLSVASELHHDVDIDMAREIGIVSHYMGAVNVAACARHGLDPRQWNLKVLDHRKLPMDFYDHMHDVIMGQEDELDAADMRYLNKEIGWHTIEVNTEGFLPDWMFHMGYGYLSDAQRQRFNHGDIGQYMAWNAELHLRRSYVCPFTSELKGADRAWTNFGPALSNVLGLGESK